MSNFILVLSVVVMSVVFAYPGHNMDMEGGPMNMTGEEHERMNMTGEHGRPMHHMNSTDGGPKHWKKHGESSEEKETSGAPEAARKRRDIGDTVQGVVDTASNAVGSAGQAVSGAVGDIEQTGKGLLNGAESEASNLIDKVEAAI